jgi:isocitrate dehydrogenase (NAD+)
LTLPGESGCQTTGTPDELDETAHPQAGLETLTLPSLRPAYQVTELLGDGIGPELSRAIHRLAESLPIQLNFQEIDFGLENRRASGKKIYDQAVETISATRVALKHPTTTAEESPNAILRRRLELSVIHRPVYTIPGVPTNFRCELDLDIVRIATGGTYDDPGRMIGRDGAVSLRIVERGPVREAARYAFSLARKTGKKVTSSSKYTIQKATDGLFEQVAEEVAGQFPEVPHTVELFDALLGKVIMAPEKFQIVLVLNEYGDFLSDMACGLAGSLGIGASANLGFDPAAVVRVALFDAAHGTAPDIAGKNLANPTAIFLALSLLLYQLGEISIGQAVKNATLDLLRQGVRTRDLGGQESTESFTEAVAAEIGRRLANPSQNRP